MKRAEDCQGKWAYGGLIARDSRCQNVLPPRARQRRARPEELGCE
ncbi:hypothetical protein [Archangium lipolyticum]|nr:hypothetical protein [Archangium lipolyticum]